MFNIVTKLKNIFTKTPAPAPVAQDKPKPARVVPTAPIKPDAPAPAVKALMEEEMAPGAVRREGTGRK
jgi:hypothetical protein